MSDIIDAGPDPASGRFLLRIDPGLHSALREAARRSKLSLNDYCARKLASPGAEVAGAAADVVQRAAALLGQALLGTVAFGSWARGEQGEDSDVDVLVVVDDATPITRELYRRWDADPLTWEGHRVEPLFVRLPQAGARISGLWAEAAVDGVVLFDAAFSVSRRLGEIRRRIAAGEVTRRSVHGQPYWVGVA